MRPECRSLRTSWMLAGFRERVRGSVCSRRDSCLRRFWPERSIPAKLNSHHFQLYRATTIVFQFTSRSEKLRFAHSPAQATRRGDDDFTVRCGPVGLNRAGHGPFRGRVLAARSEERNLTWRAAGVHSAGQAGEEWLCRKLQRTAAH